MEIIEPQNDFVRAATKEEKDKDLLIGFRLYDETGDMIDNTYFVNKKYFQWFDNLNILSFSRHDTSIRR